MDNNDIRSILYSDRSSDEKIALLSEHPSRLDRALLICFGNYSGSAHDLVPALLKAGADPNKREFDGSTPLGMLIRYANPDFSVKLARLLLDAGACPNLITRRRRYDNMIQDWVYQDIRPLAWCSMITYPDTPCIAGLLIERGALPISQAEREFGAGAAWYGPLARRVGRCLMAAKATERALLKAGLLHKDVVPLVVRYVAAMRCSPACAWDDE